MGLICNKTERAITVYLELGCEDVRVAPGQEFELLIEDVADALPVSILYSDKGLQIYPNRTDPSWLIRYKDKEFAPSWPTVLSDYD